LVVDDDGNTVSDRSVLSKAKVTAKVLGEVSGDKVEIFKYKNKTGYRRHQGHRQKYTRIEIINIELPGSKAKAKAQPKKEAEQAASEEELEMSTTKDGGSSKNGRDSRAQRPGPKVFVGQSVHAGRSAERRSGRM